MSSEIDSDELWLVIGAIFSIGEGCTVISSHGPVKGQQVDITTYAGWVN